MKINSHFNRFDEIEYMPVRVFNRTALMFNLLEDFGKETLQEYIKIFTEGEQKQMFIMQAFIKKFGVAKAREEATKDMPLVDEMEIVDE